MIDIFCENNKRRTGRFDRIGARMAIHTSLLDWKTIYCDAGRHLICFNMTTACTGHKPADRRTLIQSEKEIPADERRTKKITLSPRIGAATAVIRQRHPHSWDHKRIFPIPAQRQYSSRPTKLPCLLLGIRHRSAQI